MKQRRWMGNVMLIVAALIWGTAFVGQRVGMDSIEPMTFSAARMTLSAVVVGLTTLAFRRRERVKIAAMTTEEQQKYCFNTVVGGICCGAFLSAASMFQQMGMVYTSAGKAGFITAMYMLLVPIINLLLFRKKSGWLVWVAVLIGVAGMYLLCMTEGFALTEGDTLVFICAVLFSGHILCCDRFVQHSNPIALSAIQFVVAAVVSTVAALITETPSVEKLLSAAIPILYCGVLSGGVAFTLQVVAQKYTEPATASLLMSLESVFAVIAGAVLIGETMTSRELIGCAVMFVAIVLVQLPIPTRKIAEQKE